MTGTDVGCGSDPRCPFFHQGWDDLVLINAGRIDRRTPGRISHTGSGCSLTSLVWSARSLGCDLESPDELFGPTPNYGVENAMNMIGQVPCPASQLPQAERPIESLVDVCEYLLDPARMTTSCAPSLGAHSVATLVRHHLEMAEIPDGRPTFLAKTGPLTQGASFLSAGALQANPYRAHASRLDSTGPRKPHAESPSVRRAVQDRASGVQRA